MARVIERHPADGGRRGPRAWRARWVKKCVLAASGGRCWGSRARCDETAAAVLAADGRVLAEAVLSQVAEHARFGGVVPEIAARAHLAHLPGLVARVLARRASRRRDAGRGRRPPPGRG